jgi:transcriptional regulator with XRE-family HTH domain
MNKLGGILERKKIKPIRFAEQIGATKQAISLWITNMADPNAENIRKICKALNISADELLGIDKRED